MKIKVFFVIVACAISFVSCCCDDIPDIPIKKNWAVTGGGDFTIINIETYDTLNISGGLTITLGNDPSLIAHKGNVIKIKFEPKEEYKEFPFSIKYVLPNDKIVENQPEYEYVVSDIESGNYIISLSANWSSNEGEQVGYIISGGEFTLKVVE